MQDAGAAAKSVVVGTPAAVKYANQIVDGKYRDDRWDPVQGRWILSHMAFQGKEGVDWDKVSTIASTNTWHDQRMVIINSIQELSPCLQACYLWHGKA